MSAAAVEFDSYEHWKSAALKRDARSGAAGWVEREESTLYDYRVIRRRLTELQDVRASEDTQRLLFYMHEGFHGNMAGMGSPALYRRTAFGGTKRLIVSYIDEMVAALEQLENVPDSEIGLKEKYDFFKRSADCFGRSALMLSGAGSLGPFHIGVVKALSEQGLLPSIISGASAGSMVTAVAGTRKTEDLLKMLQSDSIVNELTSVDTSRPNQQVRRSDLLDFISALIPDMTFEEALEETGRYINISVAPTAVNQRARLLNAIQSPSACIREAVIASCAVPGVFPPVTLAAKTSTGERKPYVVSRKWVDGSITDDLPARRLTRIYGANHFISSQANPVVLWALQDPGSSSLLSQLTGVYQAAVRDWSKAVYPFTMNLVRNVYPVNMLTRMWFSLLTQEYTADINISPGQRWFNPTKLLSVLTPEETLGLIRDGEHSTWPKIEMIRNCTEVSRYIDGAMVRLEDRLVG